MMVIVLLMVSLLALVQIGPGPSGTLVFGELRANGERTGQHREVVSRVALRPRSDHLVRALVAVTRPASTMIAQLAFLRILSGQGPVARLSLLNLCSMETSATINATFAQHRMMVYLLTYGREYVGRKESDSLCDRTGWSDPASSLLHASMLCERQAWALGVLSMQRVTYLAVTHKLRLRGIEQTGARLYGAADVRSSVLLRMIPEDHPLH